jgi:hypothetical protein
LELCERKGNSTAVAVELEDANQVARLLTVEGDRIDTSAASSCLFGSILKKERQRSVQRRGPRGCVMGISGVSLPVARDGLSGLEVSALG